MHIAGLLRATLTALLYLGVIASAAVAGPLEDADAADEQGDYDTALRLLLPLAQQGNRIAQKRMGDFYASGRGVPKDYSESEKWFRQAAAQNDLDAQWNIGNIYQLGRGGIPKDFAEAKKWYLSAANQGHIQSQMSLASAYSEADGVDRDLHEAAKWFLRAANQGDAIAQLRLGIMYEIGQGVPQDYVLAHMWLNLSASSTLPAEGTGPYGHVMRGISKVLREDAAEARDGIARKMTPSQIAESQKMAREWKPKPER